MANFKNIRNQTQATITVDERAQVIRVELDTYGASTIELPDLSDHPAIGYDWKLLVVDVDQSADENLTITVQAAAGDNIDGEATYVYSGVGSRSFFVEWVESNTWTVTRPGGTQSASGGGCNLWRMDTETTAPPTTPILSTAVRFNSNEIGQATKIWIHKVSYDGNNWGPYFTKLTSMCATLKVTDPNDASRYVIFDYNPYQSSIIYDNNQVVLEFVATASQVSNGVLVVEDQGLSFNASDPVCLEFDLFRCEGSGQVVNDGTTSNTYDDCNSNETVDFYALAQFLAGNAGWGSVNTLGGVTLWTDMIGIFQGQFAAGLAFQPGDQVIVTCEDHPEEYFIANVTSYDPASGNISMIPIESYTDHTTAEVHPNICIDLYQPQPEIACDYPYAFRQFRVTANFPYNGNLNTAFESVPISNFFDLFPTIVPAGPNQVGTWSVWNTNTGADLTVAEMTVGLPVTFVINKSTLASTFINALGPQAGDTYTLHENLNGVLTGKYIQLHIESVLGSSNSSNPNEDAWFCQTTVTHVSTNLAPSSTDDSGDRIWCLDAFSAGDGESGGTTETATSCVYTYDGTESNPSAIAAAQVMPDPTAGASIEGSEFFNNGSNSNGGVVTGTTFTIFVHNEPQDPALSFTNLLASLDGYALRMTILANTGGSTVGSWIDLCVKNSTYNAGVNAWVIDVEASAYSGLLGLGWIQKSTLCLSKSPTSFCNAGPGDDGYTGMVYDFGTSTPGSDGDVTLNTSDLSTLSTITLRSSDRFGVDFTDLIVPDNDLGSLRLYYQDSWLDYKVASVTPGVGTYTINLEKTRVNYSGIRRSTTLSLGDQVYIKFGGEKLTTGPAGPTGLTGPAGPTGLTGPAGPGVAAGGLEGQVLSKVSATDYDTTWISLPEPSETSSLYLLRLQYDAGEHLQNDINAHGFVDVSGYKTAGAVLSAISVDTGTAIYDVTLQFQNEANPPSSITAYAWQPSTDDYFIQSLKFDLAGSDSNTIQLTSTNFTNDGAGNYTPDMFGNFGSLFMNIDVRQDYMKYGNSVGLGASLKSPHIYLVFEFAGSTGPAGPQGPAGPAGPQGPQGQLGPAGPVGATGLQGTTGPAGSVGPQGPRGFTGDTGATGPQGTVGVTGATGATGPQGAVGATGLQGDAGPTGATGATGPAGSDGQVGATGATGPQGVPGADSTVAGPAGPVGATGATGPQGLQGADSTVPGPAGPTGATGATGPAGADGGIYSTTSTSSINLDSISAGSTISIQVDPNLAYTVGQTLVVAHDANNYVIGTVSVYDAGNGLLVVDVLSVTGTGTHTSWQINIAGIPGVDGATGADGADGPTGATGATGPVGAQGLQGSTGATGPQGLQGSTGATGPQGLQGSTGATGLTGPQGASGLTGATGPEGPQGASATSHSDRAFHMSYIADNSTIIQYDSQNFNFYSDILTNHFVAFSRWEPDVLDISAVPIITTNMPASAMLVLDHFGFAIQDTDSVDLSLIWENLAYPHILTLVPETYADPSSEPIFTRFLVKSYRRVRAGLNGDQIRLWVELIDYSPTSFTYALDVKYYFTIEPASSYSTVVSAFSNTESAFYNIQAVSQVGGSLIDYYAMETLSELVLPDLYGRSGQVAGWEVTYGVDTYTSLLGFEIETWVSDENNQNRCHPQSITTFSSVNYSTASKTFIILADQGLSNTDLAPGDTIRLKLASSHNTTASNAFKYKRYYFHARALTEFEMADPGGFSTVIAQKLINTQFTLMRY